MGNPHHRHSARVILLSLVALSVPVGCGGIRAGAMDRAHTAWLGKPADGFFARYGVPGPRYAKMDGGSLYTWSNSLSSFVTGTRTVSECVLLVETDSAGMIVAISLKHDTLGLHSFSRCGELF